MSLKMACVGKTAPEQEQKDKKSSESSSKHLSASEMQTAEAQSNSSFTAPVNSKQEQEQEQGKNELLSCASLAAPQSKNANELKSSNNAQLPFYSTASAIARDQHHAATATVAGTKLPFHSDGRTRRPRHRSYGFSRRGT